jgi:hypothetical protein
MKKVTLFFAVMIIGIAGAIASGNSNGEEAVVKTVSLSGLIMDMTTGEALAGVKVTVDETDEFVYTDFDGNFSFDNLIPGSYQITASYISYKSADKKLNINDGSTVELKMEQLSK